MVLKEALSKYRKTLWILTEIALFGVQVFHFSITYLRTLLDTRKPNEVHLKHLIECLNLNTFLTRQYIVSKLFITL